MNEYVKRVSDNLIRLYSHEPEYLQSALTWLEMIAPAVDDPRYEKMDLLSRMVEPERMFSFLVPWVDDYGVVHTQRHRTVQGRTSLPSFRNSLRGEVPRL